MILSKQELANQLNGTKYPADRNISEDLLKKAKESGLVIVYGASDDLMEFDGAIKEEIGCWIDGGIAYFYEGKLLQFDCDNDCDYDDCEHKKLAKKKAKTIIAIWDQDGYSWIYETSIPHATFEILEDEDKYCKGIVFNIKDITGGNHE